MEEDISELLIEYGELGPSEEDRLAFFESLCRNLEAQKILLSFLTSGARSGAEPEGSRELSEFSRVFELLFYSQRVLPQEVFVVQYLPILLYLYLGRPEGRDSLWNTRLETLLLTLYNANHELFSEGFRLPSLSQSSLFHDAARIQVNEMRAWKVSTPSNPPPAPVLQRINAQSRQRVVACLLRLFNHHLGAYPKFILKSFCDTSITLLQKGYPKRASSSLPSVSRIRLSGPALLELLYGGYFCFYNDLQRLGSALVDAVHFRGVVEANGGVLSASRAAKALLDSGGAQNLNVSTPTFSQIAKNMITNASFRTKKMGDDIPLVDAASEGCNEEPPPAPSNGGKASLASISEENGRAEEMDPSSSGRISQIHSCADLKEKLIAKLPLKKKNKSLEGSGGEGGRVTASNNNNSALGNNIIPLSTPLSLNNGPPEKNKILLYKKKAHFQNNGEVIEIDSLEQVEELIKKKNLPPETITIHSPESGTTLF